MPISKVWDFYKKTDQVLVCSGDLIVFASYKYGMDFSEKFDTNKRHWCDGAHILDPQPNYFLLLSKP